ncbi:MAG: hypothetical protein K8L91_00245, partial [Anaerolineae bacterium]|nr:hypothetical protein [Anaerolineae bacterium]
MKFEHRHQPLLSRRQFFRRVLKFTAVAMVGGSWAVGILGYHYLEDLSWIDATLNAAMILGGMGPVNSLHTDAGKLFASVYALFSGMVFLVSVGVMIAPFFHRILHHFHLEMASHGDTVG